MIQYHRCNHTNPLISMLHMFSKILSFILNKYPNNKIYILICFYILIYFYILISFYIYYIKYIKQIYILCILYKYIYYVNTCNLKDHLKLIFNHLNWSLKYEKLHLLSKFLYIWKKFHNIFEIIYLIL